MRIFLDANVLFSAAKSDGAVNGLVKRLLDAGHECWADGYVADETRRNIAAKAHARLPMLDALLKRMTMSAAQPTETLPPAADTLPDGDRPVLAAAIRSHCDALVTGDRTHFGRFYGRSSGGVTIHSPRSLAEALV